MATATVETNRVYTLVLCEEEAEYLLNMTQNSLGNEGEKETKIKKSIFEALNRSKKYQAEALHPIFYSPS